MKMPNLKTLDYKQLGIDHGEKLAIGVVALLVAWVLWSTRWSKPIAQAPAELVADATSTDEKIKTQPWPATEAAKYKTGDDLKGDVVALLKPLELSPWLLPMQMNKPYHPDRTLITKPKWLAVSDLRADAQAVDLEMDPKLARLDDGFKKLKREDTTKEKAKKGDNKDKEEEPKKTDDFEEFKRTSGGGGGDAGGPGFGGISLGGRGGGRIGGRSRPGSGGGARVENIGKRKRRGKKGAEEPEDDTLTKQKKETPKPVGRGYHVVSVRGVFPLREQVAELMRVMGNSVSRREAQDLIQMHDFKLERQTARSGPDPWGGPWEPVDRESTIEMFRSDILSFAPEQVDAGLIDSHICMPLPTRLVGDWGRLATHPALKEFELSADEVQAQLDYQKKVIEKMRADELKKDSKTDKAGFAEFTNNLHKVSKTALGPGSEQDKPIQQQILDELRKKEKERASEDQINQKLIDYITKHASPQDHLLLFRFVDFNVEPGKIYRYRVKLVLNNPFQSRHAEEVADPSLIEGKTRETDDWSLATRPVYVPEDAKFFVTHVDAHPGRTTLPSAKVDLFQWFASTGTVVNREVTAQIGQVLGGLHIADVLDPAQHTYEKERVPFNTNDALVDVSQGFGLDPTVHGTFLGEINAAESKDKDAKEKKTATEAERRTTTVVPDVLVFVDRNGALRVIDGLDQQEDHQRERARYNFEKSQWDELTASPDDDKSTRGKGRMGGGKGRRGRSGKGGASGAKVQQ
jgi:hypothetical protein